MKFIFASFILAIYSLIGIGIVVFSEVEFKAAVNFYSYICLYIVIPAYGAYGIWKHKLNAVLISLLFFLSQSIRVIGRDSWFPFAPPFSLGVPFGNFSVGQGYLVDIFAIAMVIFLALLLWVLFKHSKKK